MSKRYSFTIYCVRGNHEARPQDVPDMHLIYDEDVQGEVYIQDRWPTIRYFKDWGIYTILNYKIAVVGGAYSVDKFYRLEHNLRWFPNEQLTIDEMLECTADFMGQEVDFVFTHTCPIAWEPTDLFLSSINQSSVDKSMELFLDELVKVFKWKIYCFGHYHQDRIERPRVEQYFTDSDDINTIYNRWEGENPTINTEWWLVKSPNYYKGLEIETGDYFED